MTCAVGRARVARIGASRRADPVSLVRVTLRRNGAMMVTREPPVEVHVDSGSALLAETDGNVWCVRYRSLSGLFRKDRGPSKELGRALCDEVKARFGCGGFFTTDELPRYGIGRAARRAILAATGAEPVDCVVIYAYPESAAGAMDDYLHGRLCAMQ